MPVLIGLRARVLDSAEPSPGAFRGRPAAFLELPDGCCSLPDRAEVLRIEAWHGYYRAVPLDTPAGVVGPMSGGRFLWSSDARFARRFPHPVPVHDHYETPEHYLENSR